MKGIVKTVIACCDTVNGKSIIVRFDTQSYIQIRQHDASYNIATRLRYGDVVEYEGLTILSVTKGE